MVWDRGGILDVSHRDRSFAVEQFVHSDRVDGERVAKDHDPGHSQRNHGGSVGWNASFGQSRFRQNLIARSNDDRGGFTAGNDEPERRVFGKVGLFVGNNRSVTVERFDDQAAELLNGNRIADGRFALRGLQSNGGPLARSIVTLDSCPLRLDAGAHGVLCRGGRPSMDRNCRQQGDRENRDQRRRESLALADLCKCVPTAHGFSLRLHSH